MADLTPPVPQPGAPGSLERAYLYGRAVWPATECGVQRASPCPVCGAQEARERFVVEGLAPRVVVCIHCGLGRLHPMPDADEIRSFYPDEYYGEPGVKFQSPVERMVRLVGERHLGFLCSGLAPGSRVLDVGCGRGVILGALADRGFQVFGHEISRAAARGADPRAEIRVAPTLEEAGFPKDFFDQIVIWHVLEHLRDPRRTLEVAHGLLRPGGRIIVAVPNFSSLQARLTGAAWFHLDLPRHLYQFPLPALRKLLGDTGFAPGAEHHFSLRQNPFGWIQSGMNQLAGLPRNGLYALLHQRTPGDPPPFSARTRLWLWLGLVVGAPIGMGLTLLETLLRSGATVHVVATRR